MFFGKYSIQGFFVGYVVTARFFSMGFIHRFCDLQLVNFRQDNEYSLEGDYTWNFGWRKKSIWKKMAFPFLFVLSIPFAIIGVLGGVIGMVVGMFYRPESVSELAQVYVRVIEKFGKWFNVDGRYGDGLKGRWSYPLRRLRLYTQSNVKLVMSSEYPEYTVRVICDLKKINRCLNEDAILMISKLYQFLDNLPTSLLTQQNIGQIFKLSSEKFLKSFGLVEILKAIQGNGQLSQDTLLLIFEKIDSIKRLHDEKVLAGISPQALQVLLESINQHDDVENYISIASRNYNGCENFMNSLTLSSWKSKVLFEFAELARHNLMSNVQIEAIQGELLRRYRTRYSLAGVFSVLKEYNLHEDHDIIAKIILLSEGEKDPRPLAQAYCRLYAYFRLNEVKLMNNVIRETVFQMANTGRDPLSLANSIILLFECNLIHDQKYLNLIFTRAKCGDPIGLANALHLIKKSNEINNAITSNEGCSDTYLHRIIEYHSRDNIEQIARMTIYLKMCNLETEENVDRVLSYQGEAKYDEEWAIAFENNLVDQQILDFIFDHCESLTGVAKILEYLSNSNGLSKYTLMSLCRIFSIYSNCNISSMYTYIFSVTKYLSEHQLLNKNFYLEILGNISHIDHKYDQSFSEVLIKLGLLSDSLRQSEKVIVIKCFLSISNRCANFNSVFIKLMGYLGYYNQPDKVRFSSTLMQLLAEHPNPVGACEMLINFMNNINSRLLCSYTKKVEDILRADIRLAFTQQNTISVDARSEEEERGLELDDSEESVKPVEGAGCRF